MYTEQARVAETASGADGDDDECVETQILTGRDCNQCDVWFYSIV
jgi:hypothetical protein